MPEYKDLPRRKRCASNVSPSRDRILRTPGGFLKRLTVAIRSKLRVSDVRLGHLAGKYTMKIDKSREHKSTKGNFISAIKKDQISIITFFRFLDILEIRKVKFQLTIETKDGQEHTVEETVAFNSGKSKGDDENEK